MPVDLFGEVKLLRDELPRAQENAPGDGRSAVCLLAFSSVY